MALGRTTWFSVAEKLRWVWLVLGLAAIGVLVWSYVQLPAANSLPAEQNTQYTWPEPATPTSQDWAVFRMRATGLPAASGPLSKRYRLAGTFFAYGNAQASAQASSRRAIVDDISTSEQYLVGENDTVGEARVTRIFQDHIILLAQGRQEELWLSFSETAGQGRPATSTSSARSTTPQEPLEVNRFGKRVGEARWVLNRDELMKYYRELLDDPERLASVYLSLKANRNEKGKVAGYYLDVEGEGEFFKAVGIQEGDVIRRVNSMRMTSQKRAEYFLGEFVRDRLSAVVLDVERNEKPQKLIYLVR